MNFTVIAIEMTRPARNRAYRAGLCVQCGTEPHSPGRPRCEQCHQVWRTLPGVDAVPADALYTHELCIGPVCVRSGQADTFRVRRNDMPGAGLCEMCYGYKEGRLWVSQRSLMADRFTIRPSGESRRP